MRKTAFTEEQIAYMLRQSDVDEGVTVTGLLLPISSLPNLAPSFRRPPFSLLPTPTCADRFAGRARVA